MIMIKWSMNGGKETTDVTKRYNKYAEIEHG